jgi:hypothetical protein
MVLLVISADSTVNGRPVESVESHEHSMAMCEVLDGTDVSIERKTEEFRMRDIEGDIPDGDGSLEDARGVECCDEDRGDIEVDEVERQTGGGCDGGDEFLEPVVCYYDDEEDGDGCDAVNQEDGCHATRAHRQEDNDSNDVEADGTEVEIIEQGSKEYSASDLPAEYDGVDKCYESEVFGEGNLEVVEVEGVRGSASGETSPSSLPVLQSTPVTCLPEGLEHPPPVEEMDVKGLSAAQLRCAVGKVEWIG